VGGQPILQVRDLCFAYPGRPPALSDVCIEAAEGERVGVVGPNGAGKSSLFLCLVGVLTPSRGMVRLAGLDVASKSHRRQLPAQVGIVFQNPDDQLFGTTVFDDVAFGPLNLGLSANEARERVAEALGRVGLAGFEDRTPSHLSGGEKRRVALAGVLAMRPRVLLLDEPSMYLDPRGRRELIDLLHRIGGTQVIASHDLEFVRQTCSRLLVLDEGRVIADGPAVELLKDQILMEKHGLEVPYSLRG
jgi:cobalt/nickel transport system ATP-binding protein